MKEKKAVVRYSIEEDQDGYPCTTVEIDIDNNGKIVTKKLRDYLKEDIDESLHEFIRGNVLLATRYFNHRVKAFMSKIVMGGGNPMNVDKFSYKGEFQDRGAAHVHGTLWVKLHVIEKLRKLSDGTFITKTKYERKKRKEDYEEPFVGIMGAFRKFKNDTFNDDDDDNLSLRSSTNSLLSVLMKMKWAKRW